MCSPRALSDHTHAGTAHTEAATQGVAPSSFYEDQSKDQHGAPPNAASWSFFTYVGTASLTLPITGDTKSTEWKAGFIELLVTKGGRDVDSVACSLTLPHTVLCRACVLGERSLVALRTCLALGRR